MFSPFCLFSFFLVSLFIFPHCFNFFLSFPFLPTIFSLFHLCIVFPPAAMLSLKHIALFIFLTFILHCHAFFNLSIFIFLFSHCLFLTTISAFFSSCLPSTFFICLYPLLHLQLSLSYSTCYVSYICLTLNSILFHLFPCVSLILSVLSYLCLDVPLVGHPRQETYLRMTPTCIDIHLDAGRALM